jgi:hypothetical protein
MYCHQQHCTCHILTYELQVPPGYRFSSAPVVLQSTVVTGFGRGSRQLGVPTANMDPLSLQQQLQQMPRGVYFGWAQLDAPEGWPAADSAVHKMVMNVGRRPTVNTGRQAAAARSMALRSGVVSYANAVCLSARLTCCESLCMGGCMLPAVISHVLCCRALLLALHFS